MKFNDEQEKKVETAFKQAGLAGDGCEFHALPTITGRLQSKEPNIANTPKTKHREIFVFGSNLAGAHGAGAALFALEHHGAVLGRGAGLQGASYAIPTKDSNIRTLPLCTIKQHVKAFIYFAHLRPELTFNVTRVGCGLAGYKDEDIAPLFANPPDNCVMPKEWEEKGLIKRD